MTPVQMTTGRVPVSGDLHRACGLPMVCVVQPLAGVQPAEPWAPGGLEAADVARCHDCLAYVNHLCAFNPSGWACALCGTQNDFAAAANRRYMGGPQARAALPELAPAAVDALGSLFEGDAADEPGGEPTEIEAPPVCVALVDLACGPEFLDQVRASLLAALEALPPGALFGLVGFGGGRLSLFEPCGGGAPSVRHVAVTPAGTAPTGVDLADALPLRNLLAEVGGGGGGKAAAVEAIEALAPAAAAPGRGVERPLGEAVQAVLRYLGSASGAALFLDDDDDEGADEGTDAAAAAGAAPSAGLPGGQLLIFLSGPPNEGRGSVVRPSATHAARARAAAPPAAAARPHPAPYLMDPYFPEITSWAGAVDAAAAPAAPPPSAPDHAGHSSDNASAEWLRRARARGGRAPASAGSGGWRAAAEAAAALGPAAAELGLPPDALQFDWAAERFYREAGAAAGALGLRVDLLAASPHGVGLELLRPLCAATGGAAGLWPSLAEGQCALPQDVYKRLAEGAGFGCRLRLRVSPELRVLGAVGGSRLEGDQRYEDLLSLPWCGPHDAFGLELAHAAPSGFASGSTPAAQLVVQYLRLAPLEEEDGTADNGGGTVGDGTAGDQATTAGGHPAGANGAVGGRRRRRRRRRYVLQRRVRVFTAAFPVARSAAELYAGADAQALAFALTQQVASVAGAEGTDEAAATLADWLVSLTAAFHEWVTLGEYHPAAAPNSPPEAGRAPVDASFAAAEALQPVPRLVYALLQGPLLGGSGAAGAHPDAVCALRSLWESLPPCELAAALYPHLSSWAGPDAVAAPRHSLSRAALLLANQPVYLLDAYSTLVVYYAAGAQKEALPFPPPHASALRAHVAAVRAARRRTPRVVMLREGDEGEGGPFAQWLLEDAPPAEAAAGAEAEGGSGSGGGGGGAGEVPPPSFLQFLVQVSQAAGRLVQEG